MEENQSVAYWGVDRAEAGKSNPVVSQAPNTELLEWFPEIYRLSQFVMAMWNWQLHGTQEPAEAEA